MTVKKSGKELNIEIPPEHPDLGRALDVLKVKLTRSFRPAKSVDVELINGEPALKSPYLGQMRDLGFKKDYRTLTLRRAY